MSRQEPASGLSRLLELQSGVVKSRKGSVLSRSTCLKTDHYALGRALDLDLYLQGAPNFRSAAGNLKIFGSAQPSAIGLRTVLATLGCSASTSDDAADESSKVVWICTREEPVIYIAGRSYVLREAAHMKRNFSISQRAENLESIESRLKKDILDEAKRNGTGVILVHEETADEIVAMWIAVHDVRTPRELFEEIAAEGCPLEYHRVPIASDQDPSDNYIDRLLVIIRDLPLSANIVVNCGMGQVRTTYAMSAASIIRRRQHILAGHADPFAIVHHGRPDTGDSLKKQAVMGLAQMEAQRKQSRRHLLLMSLLQDVLELKSTTALVDVITGQTNLLDQLTTALAGRYELVLSLMSCLEDGQTAKDLVDRIIDQNAAVVHLRHQILIMRLQYVSNAIDDAEKRIILRRALKALERYLFLVAFAQFVEESDKDFGQTFYQWVGHRNEIRNMIRRMRSTKQLYVFAPVHDLSAIAAAEANQVSASTQLGRNRFSRILHEGGEVAGDEFARQTVQNRSGSTLRSGTLLKRDVWRQSGAESGHTDVRGTINFRRIGQTSLYALAQPTEDGVGAVLSHIAGEQKEQPIWLTLREEPVVYINGDAYVLRESSVSLRNMKSYAGISSTRLEAIEERLAADVRAELEQGDGRVLLHAEEDNGSIVPVWEHVEPENVKTLKQVMMDQARQHSFEYRRVPMTAERSPEPSDLDELFSLVVRAKSINTPVIVNCQLGRGRSTLASITIYLVRQWLTAGGRPNAFSEEGSYIKPVAYKVIGNVVRLISHGKAVKAAVDTAVRDCNELVDLVDAIERKRKQAEDVADDGQRKDSAIGDGLHNLHRYFNLILFAAYLNQLEGDTARTHRSGTSFEHFVSSKQVFATVEKEIDAGGLSSLTPLEAVNGDQESEEDEVRQIVAERNGQIMSHDTILKSDLFLGLQKLSLPERIEGAANFRVANLALSSGSGGITPTDEKPRFAMTPITGGSAWANDAEHAVYGTGMPTYGGLRAALQRMQAGPDGEREIVWTCMREEPVLYVGGTPWVLRLLDEPMENVVTTGVTAEAVERQEAQLKDEVLREAARHDGKILLHDEVEGDNGYELTTRWEQVDEATVLTPLELFEGVQKEGYQVDYARVPVTDEQAPIPGVFARLEERVRQALSKGSKAFAYNCQMGRGRTTTGMVACTLVYNILNPPEAKLSRKDRRLSSSFVLDQRVPPQPAAEESKSTWGDERETAALSRGEYQVVLQLVSLLPNGKLAKRIADQAINQCDAVQNLRKAILDYRNRAESAQPGGSQDRLRKVARSYLYRYGLLIAFAGHLLDKADSQETLPFPEWLEKREIFRLLQRAEDDLA